MKSGGEIVGRSREAIEAAGLSQAAAAKEIGISDSALSQWLASKYEGDTGAVDAKVERWLEARREREDFSRVLPASPEWVETKTAKRIMAGLGYAQIAGDIAVIHGGAGVGKTVTALRYASRRPSVWVATVTAGRRALGSCLRLVAGACGLRPGHRRIAELEEAIADRVAGTAGLLVVDEAQHLSLRALESLRGIHDATGTGLALLGNNPLYARMAGAKRRGEYAQLHSRVGKLVSLRQPSVADVDALLDAWGARGKRIRALALQIAAHPGALRNLTKALRYAHLWAGGKRLAARNLRDAWKDMGVKDERKRKKSS